VKGDLPIAALPNEGGRFDLITGYVVVVTPFGLKLFKQSAGRQYRKHIRDNLPGVAHAGPL